MANILRDKISASGLSANQLAKLVDVRQQTISTFLLGEGISLATAQKLADYFGLVLDEPKRKRKS